MSGIFKFLFGLTFLVFFSECKKLVQVSEPINTLTAEKTFRTEANATSALIEVYNDLISGGGYGLSTFGLNYGNGATTCYLGLSADEMNFYNGGDAISMQFQNNNLQSDNMYVKNLFWLSPYFDIYLSNAVIEGVGASSLPQRVKDQLSGEAKFLRAFCNFYLVNLFDSVPLVTTTAWAHTSTLPRASTSEIYDQIKSDLQDAQNILKEDYSVSNGERVRVNKWAATAFLARVSLYLGDWKNAESQSTTIIENKGLFNLVGLDSVFLKNSDESIWQLQINSNVFPYATPEADNIIPYAGPTFYLTPQFMASFEPNDQRLSSWVDSTNANGNNFYYPSKYKVLVGNQGDVSEYYMMLRVAEQYLIRAESRALQDNLGGAIEDLNTIRTRAGLSALGASLSKDQVLAAIYQERRIELFSEWGHRWFDLKRTGQLNSVLGPVKSNWKTTSRIFPIPVTEIQYDPILTQNPGYN
ncbi:MAG: hypothetical protein BGO55_16185 [Sphingobacteriales bacterium 50-39]|nr:MAG: hypothetical protein BGO55_16185 [Sphingobacteriales bacterium 50-39]